MIMSTNNEEIKTLLTRIRTSTDGDISESDDIEECEECGICDETVEDREEMGDLGRYLCDTCYANEKALMET